MAILKFIYIIQTILTVIIMPTNPRKRTRSETPDASNVASKKQRMPHHANRFFIPRDIKKLEKAAKFTYVNQYVGKNNPYEKVFASEEFKVFMNQYAGINVYVAPVARLSGGRGAFAGQDYVVEKNKPIPIGIYFGELVPVGSCPDTSYVFGLNNKKSESINDVDGRKSGNVTRFVNDSTHANVVPLYKTITIKGIIFPYIEYNLVESVEKDIIILPVSEIFW